jgi:hypothetical protein
MRERWTDQYVTADFQRVTYVAEKNTLFSILTVLKKFIFDSFFNLFSMASLKAAKN